ncbi:hypothetical protein EDC01DRAFT_240723 [Geopyxis carbonaria]|nr:hypothetical protein EDC01DRAFT_240723 [Geopyxis carbonaria]
MSSSPAPPPQESSVNPLFRHVSREVLILIVSLCAFVVFILLLVLGYCIRQRRRRRRKQKQLASQQSQDLEQGSGHSNNSGGNDGDEVRLTPLAQHPPRLFLSVPEPEEPRPDSTTLPIQSATPTINGDSVKSHRDSVLSRYRRSPSVQLPSPPPLSPRSTKERRMGFPLLQGTYGSRTNKSTEDDGWGWDLGGLGRLSMMGSYLESVASTVTTNSSVTSPVRAVYNSIVGPSTPSSEPLPSPTISSSRSKFEAAELSRFPRYSPPAAAGSSPTLPLPTVPLRALTTTRSDPILGSSVTYTRPPKPSRLRLENTDAPARSSGETLASRRSLRRRRGAISESELVRPGSRGRKLQKRARPGGGAADAGEAVQKPEPTLTINTTGSARDALRRITPSPSSMLALASGSGWWESSSSEEESGGKKKRWGRRRKKKEKVKEKEKAPERL